MNIRRPKNKNEEKLIKYLRLQKEPPARQGKQTEIVKTNNNEYIKATGESPR